LKNPARLQAFQQQLQNDKKSLSHYMALFLTEYFTQLKVELESPAISQQVLFSRAHLILRASESFEYLLDYLANCDYMQIKKLKLVWLKMKFIAQYLTIMRSVANPDRTSLTQQFVEKAYAKFSSFCELGNLQWLIEECRGQHRILPVLQHLYQIYISEFAFCREVKPAFIQSLIGSNDDRRHGSVHEIVTVYGDIGLALNVFSQLETFASILQLVSGSDIDNDRDRNININNPHRALSQTW
jgi:hypothetical protein